MNTRLGRKGISAVVATIAILLITIAAAAFIAGIVVPLVKNRLNEGTECLSYEHYFTFYEEFDYNCYLNQSDRIYYALSIQADSVAEEKLGNLKGLRMQFLGGGESEGIDVAEGQTSDVDGIRMLNSSVLQMKVPSEGGVRTYVYNSSQKFGTVELYPVLKNGRVCEKSDSVRIEGFACDPSLNLEVQ